MVTVIFVGCLGRRKYDLIFVGLLSRRKYTYYFRRGPTKKSLFSSSLFRRPIFVGWPMKIAIFVGWPMKIAIFVGNWPIFVGFWVTKISCFRAVRELETGLLRGYQIDKSIKEIRLTPNSLIYRHGVFFHFHGSPSHPDPCSCRRQHHLLTSSCGATRPAQTSHPEPGGPRRR
jgi:hypothetical protein